MVARGTELIPILMGIVAVALIVLAFAAWIASRSKKRLPQKPPRRTFEHGRRLARALHATTPRAALDALERAPVGALEHARADDRRAEVTFVRRRQQPCPQAAGFVAGLFESAWAHEVRVIHPHCSGERGGRCEYVVERESTASARPAEGAPIRGSGAARDRSFRARAGGG